MIFVIFLFTFLESNSKCSFAVIYVTFLKPPKERAPVNFVRESLMLSQL